MISLQFQAKCTVCKAETTFAWQVWLQEGFGGMLALQLNPALPLLPLGWAGELNHTNAMLERVTCPDCVRAKKRGEKQPEESEPAVPSHLVKDSKYCPDGGTCHHGCKQGTRCFRTHSCVPLSGSGLNGDWTLKVPAEEAPPRLQEAPEQLSLYVTCHLPLAALSGGEECPRCGAKAQEHRQWAEPRLRAQQVK